MKKLMPIMTATLVILVVAAVIAALAYSFMTCSSF